MATKEIIDRNIHIFSESFGSPNITCKLAADDFDRTPNLLTKFNHALLQGNDRWLNCLHEISVLTLIIQGTEDIN
jgi:hypothetical protein